MNIEEERKLFRLLQLDASLQQQQAQPERKADALRCLALELRYASDKKENRWHSNHPADVFQEHYENTVDCLDQSTGLNNFAAGALALCDRNRNESDKWVSSLTFDSITEMSCVKSFINLCQQDCAKTAQTPGRAVLWPAREEAAGRKHKPLFKSSTGVSDQLLFRATSSLQADDRGPPVPVVTAVGSHPSLQPAPPPAVFSAIGKAGTRSAAVAEQRSLTFEDEEDSEMLGTEGARSGPRNSFRTAREQLAADQLKKHSGSNRNQSYCYGASKKSLGTRRGPNNRFVPPVLNRDNDSDGSSSYGPTRGGGGRGEAPGRSEEPVDERLKGIEPKIVELITNEIMDHKPEMDWDDIAGLQFAKKTIKEIVVWPMLRPDIFTGLRGPPKGLLLFGPPGTGKTLIGKCIASQSKSTFFCISASSLTSKWVGEGEKMVRALFAVARCHQPAVIFIDEVDSLLSQRSDGEHEASRRIKTEFLVQLDGATTESDDRILVIGATNRPQEIDEAARRRFVKRLYIPLPELVPRQHIVKRLMSQQKCQLSDEDAASIGYRTEGYSGADMANLCREAALGPIRSIPFEQMEYIRPEQVRPIMMTDFEAALPQVRPSVSTKDLEVYITWNNTYGSFGQG